MSVVAFIRIKGAIINSALLLRELPPEEGHDIT